MASSFVAIVDGPTQSGKTRTTFRVLTDKVNSLHGSILCLFVTQPNSNLSAMQVVNRMQQYPSLLQYFNPTHITRASTIPGEILENAIIVDFWNSRNTEKMLTAADLDWDNIIVVLDEVDSGGNVGVSNRLNFLHQIEQRNKNTNINVIFVTATIANLSNSIWNFYYKNVSFYKGGIVEKIVTKKCVEHHYAALDMNYVGTSWYKNTPGSWIELKIDDNVEDEPKEDYERYVNGEICQAIKSLPDENKQLSFIVVSTLRSSHAKLARKMFRLGFNVTVELNSGNAKNYVVMYRNKKDEVCQWKVPYDQIEKLADNGEISLYTSALEGLDFETHISSKDDISLSHILQASLRMGTTYHKEILKSVSQEEKLKLLAIFTKIKNIVGIGKRPLDYPETPKIALIAGALANRGNTIQNKFINFTFTSSVYYSSSGGGQRGAVNAQKLGRSNGTLLDAYTGPTNITPIMISTKQLMTDALANEVIVRKKADEIENGDMIMLKDLVTKDEWKHIVKTTRDSKPMSKKTNHLYPRRIGIIESPPDIIMGTTYERLSFIEFQTRFNLSEIPELSKDLHRMLANNGFDCNISYQQTSAKDVSNLVNYYGNPSWAGNTYHVIKMADHMIVITRKKRILDNLKIGDEVVCHNHEGKLIHYQL